MYIDILYILKSLINITMTLYFLNILLIIILYTNFLYKTLIKKKYYFRNTMHFLAELISHKERQIYEKNFKFLMILL